MSTEEWYSIQSVASKMCRTILKRIATLTLDPDGLRAAKENEQNEGNEKQKKEKKNGKRNGMKMEK